MNKEELFRDIELLCMGVFKSRRDNSEGMRGYEYKMRTYAHTAFIVTAHRFGIRLQAIADYLGTSLSNTTRLRLAYKARLQKDATFSALMRKFQEDLQIWEEEHQVGAPSKNVAHEQR